VKGLSRLRGTELRSFTVKDGLTHEVVRGTMRDRKGRLWVSGDGGVVRMDETRNRLFDPISAVDGGVTLSVRQLLEDRRGRVWAGTDQGMLVAPAGLDGHRLERPPGLDDIRRFSIEGLFEDRDGGIWIGTNGGGLRRWLDGKVESIPLIDGASIGVRAFHEDEDGTIYVGTIGSGLFVRRRGEAFKRVTSKDGLREDAIWSILQDGDTLWMSSDRGVLKLRRSIVLDFIAGRAKSVTIDRVVDTRDGMKSRECNGGGALPGLIARDGRLWFPTARGAVVIDPRKLDSGAISPPVAIEEAVVDRVMQPKGGEIVIPPGSRDIEIHYTGLSFVDPARLKFRYRLEGYDADWVNAGERRAAYFASLPPGGYRFRVEASFGDGGWSVAGAETRVIVRPTFAQTNAFRAIVALFGLGLTLGLVNWRTRHLRAREEKLSRLVATRTAELERANAQLGHLAAVDDLTGIANHRRFVDTLGQEWRRCQRSEDPLSLLICDIDDFKAYNDTLGHQAGDECLRRVARAIADAVQRDTDLAARYGGEEFAVILPSTDEVGSQAVAEGIRLAVATLRIPHPDSRAGAHVTISIGGATARPTMGAPEETTGLIASADRALYAAKRAGRDRVVHA